MSAIANKVFEEALSLPSDERVSLVEKLLTSLNLPIQAEIDRLWVEEAERRVSQIERGDVGLIPGDEVFAKIRRKYQKGFFGKDLGLYLQRKGQTKTSSMDLINFVGKRPHFSVRNVRSTVITCDTFTTESLGRPDSDAGTNTFPGASARRRFEVRTTAIAVRIRLRLKAFDWIITTGRLKPGSEAVGSGNRAHQISPRSITTPHGLTTWPEVG